MAPSTADRNYKNHCYLTNGRNMLVCESVFHLQDRGRDGAPGVTRLRRRLLEEGTMYEDNT